MNDILIYLSSDVESVYFEENDIGSTIATDRFKSIAHWIVLNFNK